MKVGQREKLIAKLKGRPKDFTFEEAETLLGYFGYERNDKGRTSGSRVKFANREYRTIMLHKPHPRKELLDYQVRQLREALEEEGLV